MPQTEMVERINQAAGFLRAGQVDQAERLCREILHTVPDMPQAHHLLGVIALQRGNPQGAKDHLGRAIAAMPDFADAHDSLGAALFLTDRKSEAVDSFKRSLDLRPDHLPTLVNLGIALGMLRRFSEAAVVNRRIVELAPDNAAGYNNLALVLRELKLLDDAEAAFRRSLALNPDQPGTWSNLGVLLADRKRFDEAADAHRKAIALDPTRAQARYNFGLMLQATGDLAAAADNYRQALALNPGLHRAHFDLGLVLKSQGEFDAAVASLEKFVESEPANADALCNLGIALRRLGRMAEGAARFYQATEADPEHTLAWSYAAGARQRCGQIEECLASHQKAVDLAPDNSSFLSDRLLALQYRPGVTAADLAREHRVWDDRFGRGAAPAFAIAKDPAKHLRIGFVSADFALHPVGFFILKLLENHDPRAFTAVGYSCDRVPDDITVRIEAAADEWHAVRATSDADLAEKIRADGIDILFDMAGHTVLNRLACFALKPAPIQITWVGYVGTTGLRAMDYLMADRYHVPPGEEAHYCERVLRMPNGYLCYDPPAGAPAVAPLPAAADGVVTFGCFNNPKKINAPLLETWADILGQVPGSRLFLKYGEMDDPITRRRVTDPLAARGIDPARLTFEGKSPQPDLLAAYGRVDIALDTSPYSGGLTTCEAMWMGVPVVTATGATFAGRHSTSHLSNVGLTECVAPDVPGYVARAVALANDLGHLADLRAGLRGRMAASPLCDGPRFARDFEALMRGVWQAWCAES